MSAIRIRHLFISRGHNFKGHHGRAPSTHPIESQEAVECVARKGLAGDRFFDHKDDFKGQITFFAWEVFEALRAELPTGDADVSALRRNVVVENMDLDALIGKRFEIDGVEFEGTEECAPCYWMDRALGAGAEEFLTGRGGLRAKILSSGSLALGEGELRKIS